MGILALLLAWAAGWPWVRSSGVCGGLRPRWAAYGLEILLALAAGLGATSALFFVLLWAGLPALGAVIAADVLVAVCGLLAWKASLRAAPAEEAAPPVEFRFAWIAAVAFGMAMLLLIAGFLAYANSNPQGNWDAWAIWNLRAKFLSGADTWRGAVSPELGLTHPEYPLLWSGVVARAWIYGGNAMPASVPIAAAGLMTFGSVLLLVAALLLLRGAALGWTGGVILLCTTSFWRHGPGQYADVPLGFFMLAALVAAVLAERRQWYAPSLAFAGLLAGLASFIKNEGMLFFAACAVVMVVAARKQALPWLVGALPFAVLTAAFKLFLAPPVKTIDPRMLADMGRLGQVAKAFPLGLWNVGDLPGHPILLLVLLAIALKLRSPLRPWWPLAPVTLLLAGDFVVVWGTPNDLVWQIETALDRLMVQVIPALIFGVLLLVRAPEAVREPGAQPGRSETRARRRQQH